jgi:hypothetical protein
MALTLPEDDKLVFTNLAGFSPDQRRLVVSAFAASTPASNLLDFARKVARLAGLTISETHDLVQLFGFLSRLQVEEEIEVLQLADDITEAMQTDQSIKPPTGGWDAFRDLLVELLEKSTALRITSKASEVIAENERRLCPDHSRVISDVRPVFSDEIGEQPDAAVVVHTLKIAYHQSDSEDVKEFFVSLDSQDLEKLQDLIDRAREKEESLKSMVKKSGVPYLDTDTEEEVGPDADKE